MRWIGLCLLLAVGCKAPMQPQAQAPHETPIRLSVGDRSSHVAAQLNPRKQDPSAEYFLVQGVDGKTKLTMGHGGKVEDIWTLGEVSQARLQKARSSDPYGDDAVVTWRAKGNLTVLGVPSGLGIIKPEKPHSPPSANLKKEAK